MQDALSQWLIAGVVVTLAFFLLVAYLVRVLRANPRLPTVIVALGVFVGALPAILYALYHASQAVG
ncbi:hypothetical protein LHJ74_29020 [Streptomyces sp. N2-109]|uniref:Cardiolipin synthase N-terminal domain-containing protein n=1 Tax=Streptomyces gossypii TaxID=2883101 RepID=A0ABT2K156_9ACTN|nr:hypothetical protein [Streptomyces gossypii]MCT2593902.1 hypothetical protein [Streptomyces gossypii]